MRRRLFIGAWIALGACAPFAEAPGSTVQSGADAGADAGGAEASPPSCPANDRCDGFERPGGAPAPWAAKQFGAATTIAIETGQVAGGIGALHASANSPADGAGAYYSLDVSGYGHIVATFSFRRDSSTAYSEIQFVRMTMSGDNSIYLALSATGAAILEIPPHPPTQILFDRNQLTADTWRRYVFDVDIGGPNPRAVFGVAGSSTPLATLVLAAPHTPTIFLDIGLVDVTKVTGPTSVWFDDVDVQLK